MKTRSTPVVKNEYDQILQFARDVVPKNWNIYWSWSRKEQKKVRHTCNIKLHDDPYCDILEDGHLAMVHNMRWIDGVMFADIYLDTFRFYTMEETILHELAHIAEQRYIMLKDGGLKRKNTTICGAFYRHADAKKSEKAKRSLPFINKYEDHGELFGRCLNAFHLRTKKRGKTLDLAKLFALPR